MGEGYAPIQKGGGLPEVGGWGLMTYNAGSVTDHSKNSTEICDGFCTIQVRLAMAGLLFIKFTFLKHLQHWK